MGRVCVCTIWDGGGRQWGSERGEVNYRSLCRKIPPMSLHRSLERKSKHTSTHKNTASLQFITSIYLCYSCGRGGARGIGECREMGLERKGWGKTGRWGQCTGPKESKQEKQNERDRERRERGSVGFWDSWDLEERDDIFCCHDNCLHVSAHSLGPMLARPHREEAHTRAQTQLLSVPSNSHAACLATHLSSAHLPSLRPPTLQPSLYAVWLPAHQHPRSPVLRLPP